MGPCGVNIPLLYARHSEAGIQAVVIQPYQFKETQPMYIFELHIGQE